MVSVDYSGLGGGNQTTSLKTGQAWSPYVVNRDGDFRFPLVYQQDRLPLSRLQRSNYALGPTVTMPYVDLQRPIKVLDKDTVRTSVYPTYTYITDFLNALSTDPSSGIQTTPNISIESTKDLSSLNNSQHRENVNLKDSNVFSYITPKTNIYADIDGVRHPLNSVSLVDKQNIAVMAEKRLPINTIINDQPVKLKDYNNIAVESNKTGDFDLVIRSPQVILTKATLDVSSVSSGISNVNIDTMPIERKAKLAQETPLQSGSLFSQAYMPFQYDKSIREYTLQDKLTRFGPFGNQGTIDLPPVYQKQGSKDLAGVRENSVYNRYQNYQDRFKVYSQQA